MISVYILNFQQSNSVSQCSVPMAFDPADGTALKINMIGQKILRRPTTLFWEHFRKPLSANTERHHIRLSCKVKAATPRNTCVLCSDMPTFQNVDLNRAPLCHCIQQPNPVSAVSTVFSVSVQGGQ